MSYRYMRQLLFFDLPTDTPQDKKEYRRFRKFLLSEGFIMLQFSVYTKLTLNDIQAKTITRRLEQNKPKSGNVVVLKVTEKQFAQMTYLLGEKDIAIANTDQRVVFLGEELRSSDSN
ncbi:CRISPR-associated protein Cas2 [Enterococcus sp. PF1-24]|uniref:CRISPR-associated endonuclease Cas2 n=1 Tax=unclassified Enterococcus TaxID=2608891 RepID=UPI002476026A|nr:MULTISPECIES: CRISPR-associated endonuclease Cas2 [unclassified Enterococcus]MDH6365211.1 CRISPR-associated protein Cas2 [Enterococcus sp. PFB1-1]MDH6402312.1 CRISPR-associated protein Cas2 [Enterococcus sp. PF1-24]